MKLPLRKMMLLAVAMTAAGGACAAQNGSPLTVPFDRWVREGESSQIPWKVRITAPELGFSLRLYCNIEAVVDGKALASRLSPGMLAQGKLVLISQFTDSQGYAQRGHVQLDFAQGPESSRTVDYTLALGAYLTPGDYRADIVAVNTATGEHSMATRTVHVGSWPGMEAYWSRLPTVEVLSSPGPPEAWFHPEVRGPLALAAEPRRPLRVHVILNLPSATLPQEPPRMRSALVAEFKALAQLTVRDGSRDAAVLDLDRAREVFLQDGGYALDWTSLRPSFLEQASSTIDVTALSGQSRDAEFFASRMNRPGEVIILLGTPMRFQQRDKQSSLERSNTRIFYVKFPVMASMFKPMYEPGRVPTIGDPSVQDMKLHRQYDSAYADVQDDVEKLLKGAHARIFRADTPEAFQKAVAAILKEIAAM